MATKETKPITIEIPEIRKGRLLISVVGTRPLICNRMSEKARHTLLLPSGRKTAAEKQSSLKHDPLSEYQASPYRMPVGSSTLIALMSSAFKGAMSTAALDLPGTKKAQIGRLVFVESDYTPVYGKPYLFMSVTRSADMNRTPDIRTRAILPRWACQLSVTFVQPLLNAQAIYNLLAAAGVSVGVGDWRPEKGKGDYGQFRIVNADDPELVEILQEGRIVQERAMLDPEPYDGESAEMLSWWSDEVKRRGFDVGQGEDSDEEEETDV